jgi:hypothetical protein
LSANATLFFADASLVAVFVVAAGASRARFLSTLSRRLEQGATILFFDVSRPASLSSLDDESLDETSSRPRFMLMLELSELPSKL